MPILGHHTPRRSRSGIQKKLYLMAVLSAVVFYILGVPMLSYIHVVVGCALSCYLCEKGARAASGAYVLMGLTLMAVQILGFVGFMFFQITGLGTVVAFLGVCIFALAACFFVHSKFQGRPQAHGSVEWTYVKAVIGFFCLLGQLLDWSLLVAFGSTASLVFVIPFGIAFSVVLGFSGYCVYQGLKQMFHHADGSESQVLRMVPAACQEWFVDPDLSPCLQENPQQDDGMSVHPSALQH